MTSASTSITTLNTVIDLAIALEKHGRDYYAHARDTISDQKCKKLFTWLVEQEEEHYQTYLQLRGSTTETTFPLNECSSGYHRFIQILVNEITEALKESAELTVDEAIEQALFFEESVIKYFQKVQSQFSEKQAVIIQKICDEEQEHIDAINQYRTELEAAAHDG